MPEIESSFAVLPPPQAGISRMTLQGSVTEMVKNLEHVT